VKPEPAPVKLKPRTEPKAARAAESKPRAALPPAKVPGPVVTPEPPRPLGQANSTCIYKPVMTDEEIARCR
jgi:hypothetical protein